MPKRLSATLVQLIYEAALKSFWRRNALSQFLRQAGISQTFISAWGSDQPKRAFLDGLFAKLSTIDKGQEFLLKIGRDLAAQQTFPDLTGWEDSEKKLKEARSAVVALRSALQSADEEVQTATDRRASQERIRNIRAESQRTRQTLASLDDRLTALAERLGSSEAGYEFQKWFFDLVDFFEIVNRRPYVASGRQIDGSITVSGTTYLVELKFTRDQSGATDIDSASSKIIDKADNTMAIVVSMSGYSSVAVAQASKARTVLLMDYRHVYCALHGGITLSEMVDRLRRHASQTGEAYLAPEAFGG